VKWQKQLANQNDDVHRVAADLMVFYYLFAWNITTQVKRNGVREVLSWKLGDESDPPGLAQVDAAFEQRIGHTGIYYLTGRPWQIAFYLDFARRLIREGVDPLDAAACQRLADSVQQDIAGSQAARHILLHLLFPDSYEGIASTDHKNRIRTGFLVEAGDAEDLDAGLLNVRHALNERYDRSSLSFYQPDIRAQWDKAAPEPEPPPQQEGEEVFPNQPGANLNELITSTHLPEADIREIEELLLERRQVIFEGPPGSGKTYIADLFARWFVGLPLGGPVSDRLELIQFHQAYGYEDFVQGIRPETDTDGHLRYRVRDGIFKRLCELAATDPDHRYVLIIDEINRGNTARIFGELLLLLEYRDRHARLPYASPDAGDEAYLSIPSNLYLIGTMNSTDRSLAQVDYALRRRFFFRRFLPVEEGKAPVLNS
jgi:hypothetical protein